MLLRRYFLNFEKSDYETSSVTAGSVALEALSLIGNALTRLEVGEMCVVSFGECNSGSATAPPSCPTVLHQFGSQFTSDSGVSITSKFTFEQKRTDMVESVLWMDETLKKAREKSSNDNSQLVFLITDALGCNPESLMRLKKMTRNTKNCLYVLIIIDTGKKSILDLTRIVFDGPKRKPRVIKFMDQIPFDYYVVVRDVLSLPEVLGDSLRQWWESMGESA